MYAVTVISVGSIKEQYWQDAAAEYLRRMQPYCRVAFREVPEEPISKVTDRKRILAIEAERILKNIPIRTTLVALDRTGAEFTSSDLATKIQNWSQFGNSITFIIGGPLGLAAEVLTKSHTLLSLSKLTFTHQQTRVILLEQLYRAAMIIHGKQYHY